MLLNKIHLACGKNIFSGWDNYDYEPINGARYIDLQKPLDFQDNSIEYIYFEHALEHFDEVDGYNLLKEFYRILKNDGIVRIVTPSLDTYIFRYLNWNNEVNNEHQNIFHSPEQFLNYAFFGENTSNDLKFLNNLNSSNIGHKYLYSQKDLINKAKIIGFKKNNICNYKQSQHEIFSNLETRKDNIDIILELTK
jgi:predicted SAM-dependent methyltransferase